MTASMEHRRAPKMERLGWEDGLGYMGLSTNMRA